MAAEVLQDGLGARRSPGTGGERPQSQGGQPVRVLLTGERFSRLVYPIPPEVDEPLQTDAASISYDGGRRVGVVVSPSSDGGRAAYFWSEGRLKPLF